MATPLTINDLIHPFQKGSMAIALRAIEQDLTIRYFRNIQKTISAKCFMKKDDYYVYFKIPSERNIDGVKDIFYDVILRFFPKNKDDFTSSSIRNYGVQVFSNSPAFMFTFTHRYSKQKLLLPIPKKYYGKQALKEEADIRNPLKLVGIDKTIWFSELFMTKHRLFTKTVFESLVQKKLDLNTVLNSIKSQEDKLIEVQRRDKTLAVQKRKNKYKKAESEQETQSSESISTKSSLITDMSTSSLKVTTTKSPHKSTSLKSTLSKR